MAYNRKLIDYVPPYYDELLESTELLSAEDAEFTRLNAGIDDLLLQFNVSTATWGLREWERILGITSPVGATTEMRRTRILAKLRGAAPATYANMLAIMNAHTTGRNNEIVEIPSPGVVKFLVDASENFNYGPLIEDIRTYIPAHLSIQFGSKATTNMCVGMASIHGANITVYPYRKEFVPIETSVTHGGASVHAHTVLIYPKGAE